MLGLNAFTYRVISVRWVNSKTEYAIFSELLLISAVFVLLFYFLIIIILFSYFFLAFGNGSLGNSGILKDSYGILKEWFEGTLYLYSETWRRGSTAESAVRLPTLDFLKESLYYLRVPGSVQRYAFFYISTHYRLKNYCCSCKRNNEFKD